MISVTSDYRTAALSNYRKPRARVKVTWADTVTDALMTAVSSDENRGAKMSQIYDNEKITSYKWAYCPTGSGSNELIADGSFHPLPSDTISGQVGWFNSIASDASGEWVADPLVTLSFTNRPFVGGTIEIQCDTIFLEYPEAFTVRLYNGASLLHTQAYSGNTDTTIEVELTGVNQPIVNGMTIEIHRWSTPYGIVKINEIRFNVSTVYYDDSIVLIDVLEEMDVEEGSLPIGNISANEINLTLSNEDRRFSHGNTNSEYYGLLKKDRKIELWFGFVLPAGSSDTSSGHYIVETIDSELVGFLPYGVYWSDEWIEDQQSMTVNTYARDIMDLFRRMVYDSSSIYEDETLYNIANTVMIAADANLIQEIDWTIDSLFSGITIPIGFFDKKPYFDVLKEIAIVGSTVIYADRTGIVRIGAAPVVPGSSPEEATWTVSDYFDNTVSPKAEELANRVEVTSVYIETEVSSSTIYSSSDQYVIPPGETTIDITLTWDNLPVFPATVVPTITNVVGTSTITASAFYAWGGYLTVTGLAGNTFTLSATGIKAVEQSKTEYVTQDAGSLQEHGNRVFSFPESTLIQSFGVARQIGDTLLSAYKNPRRDASVSLPSNTIVELGDPILLTEYKDDVIETNTYFYIIRQALTYNGALDSTVELRRFIL